MAAKTRTMSMEIRAIREHLKESPPPPPVGTTVKQWFAGLVLLNPVLMKGLEPHERAAEAARLADELMRALETPRVPSAESMLGPTPAQMTNWEEHIAAQSEQDRPTVPDLSKLKRAAHSATIPPPPPSSDDVHSQLIIAD